MGAVDAAMNESDEQDPTAHHEAGHAVAALVRGGVLISITIHPTPEHPEYAGKTNFTVDEPSYFHFAVYAGPWAEARSQWPQDSLNSLDDEDDDGRPFRDYVRHAFDVIDRDGDSVKYFELEEGILPHGTTFKPLAPLIAEFERRPIFEVVADREQEWSRRLEEHWPTIRTVAGMLLDGSTDVDAITAAVRG